ncbi:hypothetical protein KUTeg_012494 [Tegillarca granosa]|uniref:Major facilitator superfamily (MFS) profile domain-containing protein n=1 Tax=Tegillarca granosa TaxID=220873 RepID=A0ABQ9EZM7_TEGGR|nr:hypothetical protein KUTeg_012494 [Tegillarca granosa]
MITVLYTCIKPLYTVCLLGYFISSFFMVGTAKSFGILLTEFTVYFDIEAAKAATIMAVSGAVYTITAPFCLAFGLYFTQRKVVIFGVQVLNTPFCLAFGQYFTQRKVVIFGAIFGCLMISQSYFLLNIGFVIIFYGIGTGISNACMFGNGMVMVGKYFHDRRSLANGLSLTGASVGQFAIPPLLQYLLDEYGLRGTVLLVGALYLHVVISGFLYRPLSFYERKKNKAGDESEKQALTQTENLEHKQGTQEYEKHGGDDPEILIEMDLYPLQDKYENKRLRYLATSTGSFKMASLESLTHIAVSEDKEGQQDKSKQKKKNGTATCCGKSFDIPKIFNFSVLKMPVVIFYVIVSFFLFFGYFNFIIFLPPDVLSRGISKYEKALLVSFAGIGDLFGRIGIGILGDLNVVKRYKIMAIVCLLCGLDMLIFTFTNTYWLMSLLAVLYGIFGGGYVAINAIVLIDLVGLQIMPNALGVVLLIQGLGAAIGQPILGKHTKTYLSCNRSRI